MTEIVEDYSIELQGLIEEIEQGLVKLKADKKMKPEQRTEVNEISPKESHERIENRLPRESHRQSEEGIQVLQVRDERFD